MIDHREGAKEVLRSDREATTILVVEDEEPIRDLVATALRFRGYTVVEASGGGEGATATAIRCRHGAGYLPDRTP